jgi:hypothetical protein
MYGFLRNSAAETIAAELPLIGGERQLQEGGRRTYDPVWTHLPSPLSEFNEDSASVIQHSIGRSTKSAVKSPNAKREIKLVASSQFEQQKRRPYSDNVKLDLFAE